MAGSARRSTTSPFHKARRERLNRELSRAGYPAILLTNPRDIRWLTGYRGDDSVLLVTPGARKPWIISDSRYEEDLAPFKHAMSVVMRKGALTDEIIRVIGDVKPRKVAVQADHLTVATRAVIAKGVGAKRLVDTTGLVKNLRAIKDKSEIETLRRAIKVQEAALKRVLRTIRPGQTELEIAARLEAEMRTGGAESVSFPSIVGAGANGSKPHGVPGAAKVKRNDTILIDWGACVDGYRGDMTRVFALGKWPRKMAEVYKVVLDAHLAGIAAVAPGKTGKDIDAVARAVITKAGYGDRFGHGLGHGIGLDVHEEPGLNKMSKTILKPGMVVTVEPGVYLPGVGGVRIEDDILVTDRGGVSLCSLPKDLDWATL